MGPLDEKLKELRQLDRDKDAKMRSFHQAKAKLYEGDAKKDTSFGKIIGVPIALISAVFIGFILSYQWFGDNLGGPAIDEDRTEPFIQSPIDHIFIGFGDSVNEFRLSDKDNPELEYVMIDTPGFLERFEIALNSPRTVVEKDFIPMLEVELVLENGEEVPLFFTISSETGDVETFVYEYESEVLYQYEGDLVSELREFLKAGIDSKEEEDSETIYNSIEAALEDFPYDIVTPGENPVGLLVNSVSLLAKGNNPYGIQISYMDKSDGNDRLVFAAISMEEEFDATPYQELDLFERNGREFSLIDLEDTVELRWEENNILYTLLSISHVGAEELLDLTDEMYGISNDITNEEERSEYSPFERYAVFTEYELRAFSDHIAESNVFYKGESTDYILGFGHQSHAVYRYMLYEVNEENNQVKIIRRIVDSYQDQTEALVEAEDWDGLINLLLENGQVLDQVYFKYSNEVTEEEVEIDGTIYSLYPVEVEDNIHYFKEGQGLWMKVYNNELTLEIVGEENNRAIRILD